MRRDHDGGPSRIDEFKQIDDFPGQVRVQVPRGFVGEQDHRSIDYGSGDADPLLLSRGKSRRHLIPALTHETKAAERKRVLEGFQEGVYRAIVTSKVLNEGVDVPEAKVAIILSGSASAREYVQRLGRVLRKVENRQAVLFEVIVRDTVEEGRALRRKPSIVGR